MFTGLSFKYTRCARSMVTTMRICVSSFTVFVFGTSTSMPDCRIGAVIMKMISSTSTTSTNGTILISERELPVSRCICGITHLYFIFVIPSPAAGLADGGEGSAFRFLGASNTVCASLLAVKRLNLRHKLRRKTIHPPGQPPDSLQIMVVSNHRGDRGEKSRGGCDQRLRDSRRHRPQARAAGVSQSRERVHHPPHRAEQPDERRNRACRREPRHSFFQVPHLFARRHLHLHPDGVRVLQPAGIRMARILGSWIARSAHLRVQFAVTSVVHRYHRPRSEEH